jgi:hypothetical protein
MSYNFSLSEIMCKGVVLVIEWPIEAFSTRTPLVGNNTLIRGDTLNVPLFIDCVTVIEVSLGKGSSTNKVDSFIGIIECISLSILRSFK